MAEEFKVVLEGIELSPEQREQLNKEIQRAVLSQLAELDLGLGDDLGLVVRPQVFRPGGGLPGIVLERWPRR